MACAAASAQKNPKVFEKTLIWLGETVVAFGAKLAIKPQAAFTVECLSHTNVPVRAAAADYAAVLYRAAGNALKPMFAKEKPAIVEIVTAKFDATGGAGLPAPTKFEVGDECLNVADGANENEAKSEVPSSMKASSKKVKEVEEDLIGDRVNLVETLKPSVIAEISDPAWKVRAAALQELQDAITAAGHIAPSLGDISTGLTVRLRDSNKNIVITTLQIIGMIADAGSPAVKKYLPHFLPAIFENLADGKEQVRQAALATMDAWNSRVGLAAIVEADFCATALASGKPFEQAELLRWLSMTLAQPDNEGVTGKYLVKPVLACLDDRSKDVRTACSDCVTVLIGIVGRPNMSKAINKLSSGAKAIGVELLSKVDNSPPPPRATSAPVGKKIGAGTTKGTAAKRPATAGTKKKSLKAAAADDDVKGGLMLDKGGKEKRMKAEKGGKTLKWSFTAPREEFVTQLKDQALSCTSAPLHNCLFHKEFRMHVQALDILTESVQTQYVEAVAGLDVLLRWITLRFYDTNPQVILKSFVFLQDLFDMLVAESYELNDFEAGGFLPYLVNQTGHKLDSVRTSTHTLMRTIIKTYPASKLFCYLLEGLSSKNSKQRAELLTEVDFLIEKQGMSVCQVGASKSIKAITKQIDDKDASVRNAALDALVTIYNFLGNDIYKLMGTVSEKTMGMVRERIKRRGTAKTGPTEEVRPVPKAVSRKSPAKSLSISGGAKSPERSRPVPGHFNLDAELLNLPSRGSLAVELISTEIGDDFELDDEIIAPERTLRTSRPSSTSTTPDIPALSNVSTTDSTNDTKNSDIMALIQRVADPDPSIAVDALKAADNLMKTNEGAVHSEVNGILSSCSAQLGYLFTMHFCSDNAKHVADGVRLCKHLLGFVLQLFRSGSVAALISAPVLQKIIRDLLLRVQDPQLEKLEEGPQVTRALNCILLKVLQSVTLNVAFATLLTLLAVGINDPASHNAKYIQLVQRCIWKLVKALPDSIGSVNTATLLQDVQKYFALVPFDPNEVDEGNMPLRTIKTVIQTITKIRGPAIVPELAVLGGDAANSVVGAIVLDTLRSDGHVIDTVPSAAPTIEAASPDPSSGRKTVSLPGSPEPAMAAAMRKASSEALLPKPASPEVSQEAKLNPVEQDEKLVQIFAMIISKEETKQGMVELYDFTMEYPDTSIAPYLETTSPFFQNHIRRCLEDIRKQRTQTHGSKVPRPTGSANAAQGYLSRLRKLTTDTTTTAAGTTIPDFSKTLERKGLKERNLPDIEPDTRARSPNKSPTRQEQNQLNDLKARLARFKK